MPKEKVRLHACWGNYEGPHDHDVPLRDILPILQKAKAGALFLPFANPQHAHEYKVLRDIPLAKDQILIAGVIDTTTNYMEHPETVADRLERIAEAMGDPARVMAGTDCGFDTSAGMGRVAEDVVWGKLKALSAGRCDRLEAVVCVSVGRVRPNEAVTRRDAPWSWRVTLRLPALRSKLSD